MAGEHAGDLGQHEVAGAVAVDVVDGLEAVDVADQHRALGAGRELAADGVDPAAAVVQAGQVVRVGDGLEPADGLGEVARGARGRDARALGDLVEQLGAGAEPLERDPEQRAVDLVAGQQVGDRVGDLHAGGLGATGRRARSAPPWW